MTDSDGPVSSRGTVRAMVLDRSGSGAAAVGVPVVFVDPDGTIVKSTSTDASGSAEADVLPGASVTTVLAVSSTVFAVSTTLAIKPGDHLVLGGKNEDATPAGDLTVSWPESPGSPASYAVFGPCGPAGAVDGSTRTKQFTLFASCKHSPLEILVAALDATGAPLAFNGRTGIAFAPNSSVALDNMWIGPVQFTAAYTGVSQVERIEVARQVTDGFGWSTSASRDVAGSASVQVTVPGPIGAVARIQTTLTGTGGRSQVILQDLAGSASTYGLDVAASTLAWLARPTFDVATRTVRVEHMTDGTASLRPDLFRVLLTWQRNQTQFSWTVSGPDAATVQLPSIPASVGADVNPMVGEVVQLAAATFEADGFADYDAVRSDIAAALDTFNGESSAATIRRRSNSP